MVRVEFKSANFHPRSQFKNHLTNYLDYEAAAEANVLGQEGSTITLVGDRAVGTLNFDRKGYPGRNGDNGQDADPNLRPEKNPAVGRNAEHILKVVYKWSRSCDGVADPVPRRDRFRRHLDSCEYVEIKCARPADHGPQGLQGFMGGPGGQAHPGGHTGKVFIQIKDRTQLVVNQTAAGGLAGRPGFGGQGGPGGDPGTPGQSFWIQSVRDFMGMAAWDSDENVLASARLSPRHDPCPAPSAGSVGPRGPQGPDGPTSVNGMIEPLFVWDQDANAFIEWRTN
jgi:hypothetical protein